MIACNQPGAATFTRVIVRAEVISEAMTGSTISGILSLADLLIAAGDPDCRGLAASVNRVMANACTLLPNTTIESVPPASIPWAVDQRAPFSAIDDLAILLLLGMLLDGLARSVPPASVPERADSILADARKVEQQIRAYITARCVALETAN